MIKLNIGCGLDYKESDDKSNWINVDSNRNIKADIYLDLNESLPFSDCSVDYVLMDNVLEHINPGEYFSFLEEIHRICKPGAVIEIYVPHYSGMYALKHPTHYKYFGVGSFDIFRPEKCFNGERYSNARFNLISEKLLFFHHNLVNYRWLIRLPINWALNFSRSWQLLIEKFSLLKPDEMYYKLGVLK